MKVDLMTNDQSAKVVTVDVPDFPNNPHIVGYKGRYFTAEFGYGPHAVTYVEQTFLDVSNQVTAC